MTRKIRVDRIAGLAEAAEAIRMTKQATARALKRPDAPAPVRILASGPLYDLDDIEEWNMTRKKTPGPYPMERLGYEAEQSAGSMVQLRRAVQGDDGPEYTVEREQPKQLPGGDSD